MPVPIIYFLDNNECHEKTNNCEQICINELGGFSCKCRQEYLLNNDGRSCRRKYMFYILNNNVETEKV